MKNYSLIFVYNFTRPERARAKQIRLYEVYTDYNRIKKNGTTDKEAKEQKKKTAFHFTFIRANY